MQRLRSGTSWPDGIYHAVWKQLSYGCGLSCDPRIRAGCQIVGGRIPGPMFVLQSVSSVWRG